MAPSHETHRIAVMDNTWNKINLPCSARRAIGSWLNLFALASCVLLAVVSAQGQSVTATVATGSTTSAIAVAVDLVRNKIYVANAAGSNAGSVTVIDGATNSHTTFSDSNATDPQAVAVNPVTNKIYVANRDSSNVTVIDGSTGSIKTTVGVGNSPLALAVNPQINAIYVANNADGTVSVINGSTDTVTATVAVGSNPSAVAVNPATNRVYVANSGSGTVSVINGATNAVVASPSGATSPVALAVDPVTNQIYVADTGSPNLIVIDGATNNVTTFSIGEDGTSRDVAVNPVTNMVYVADTGVLVSVFTGATATTNAALVTTVGVGTSPYALAVDPVSNKIYVANYGSNNVSVIDGATDGATTVTDTNAVGPYAVTVNPVTNKVYVANNSYTSNVTVIDGADYQTTTVTDSTYPTAVAVNPVTNTAYVADYTSNYVTVITGLIYYDTVSTGTHPTAVAVNPVTNTIYVANNGSSNVTVIDGATDNPTTVADPNAANPSAVAVNPVTNTIYVANNGSSNVTVINGATNATTTVTDPNASGTNAVAVNPVTNQIYVTNNTSDTVTVIDGATNTVTASVGVGTTPVALAVNPVTNRIYVANYGSNNVSVIDGATNTLVATVADIHAYQPTAVDVNPVTNTIYVADYGAGGDFPSVVTAINGADNSYTSVADANASEPYAVAVNPVTNKIYVPSYVPTLGDGSYINVVTVIDGATNTITDVNIPGNYAYPDAVAVNPVTSMVYVADSGTGGSGQNTTIITEQQVQAIPILSSIMPLTGNQTASLTPTFNFTATNSFTTASVDNLLYQVDTWQAPWLVGASQGGGNFNGNTSALQPGFHILYTYSTDGEEGTSTNSGVQSGPLMGSITAYGFLVAAPEAALTPGTVSFASQAVGTAGTEQTVTLTNSGSAPLAVASVAVNGTNPNDFLESDNCVSSSPIAAAGTCTLDLTFKPTAVGARTAALVVTNNSGDVTGSQQTVNLAGTSVQATTSTAVVSSANPSILRGAVTFTATVTPQGSLTPTGTVTFKDGTAAICTAATLSLEKALCSISTLTAGLHSITAVYSGDTNFVGSTSPALSQTVSLAPLTIAASSSTTAYGTAIPAVTPSYTGFINGDTAASLTTPPTCTTTGVPAGHPVGTYTGANNCSGAVDSNYTITYVPGNVQITLAVLTITASSGSFTYGGTVPAITPSYSGFLNGDTAASLTTAPTCSTTATTSSSVAGSPYASTCSGAVDGNYTIQYVKGSVTESAAALTVTASNGTFIYGGTVPAITPGYSGFVSGDTAASLGTRPTCSTTAASSSPVSGSPYPSTCSGAVDGNYAIQYVKGSVTESAAALTITASSGTFAYGGTVPAITPGYSGFVNGDTAASLTTPPTCSTTATSSSPVSGGPYPTTCAGAVDTNYAIKYVNGALTESAATTTTAITSITPNPSMAGQPVTVSYTVTVNAPGSGTVPSSDKVTVTDSTGASCQGAVAAGNCALVPTAVGPDLITATYSGDSNFSTSKASGSASFSIVPSISLTGLTPANPPTQSTSVGVALNSPTPTQLTGTLTLSFQSNAAGTPANYIDPATQFAAGGTTLNFTIPAGSAVATLPQSGAIQQGTTAGTITVTLTSLVAGTTTVALPQPTPSLSVVVTPMVPVITSGSGTITSLFSTGFNVELDAYSTPRDLANATFTFQATSGDQLNGASPSPVSLSSVAPSWFSSSSGLQSGGLFHLTVPFSFSGNTSALGSVTVTLSNSAGTSSPVSVVF